ncbi:aromatic amino acid transaminase [Brevundimonas faecalis]|uniref:amino acid aminotransferase n=1 Tax=Brevundimonas faecalis TaxID=947378 RepID=UPI003610E20B
MFDRPAQGLFGALTPQAPDPLLSLIALYREDARPEKIDLGVGVYRDEAGHTPIMRAMKAAERKLVDEQPTKSYLGPEGDVGFVALSARLAMGPQAEGLIGVQTPGGTGALRLAAALVQSARPGGTVWLGAPSWPIHAPIFESAGLKVRGYRHYDPATGALAFEDILEALGQASAGDVFLIHGCCHNPSGADPDAGQWAEIARLTAERGVVPLIDLAYQGLGEGLDEDAAGARLVVAAVDEALIAYSCDKNFGLYRERTGALFVKAAGSIDATRSNLHALARYMWSMPPDHGAAATRIILETPALAADWRMELDTVRERLNGVRQALAAAHPRLAPLGGQKGMFSLLPLAPDQVIAIRKDHAVYMAGSGRINIAGLTLESVPRFVQAFDAVLSN